MAYDIYNDMNVVAELPWNKILVKWNKTPIDKWVYITQKLQKVSTNKYSNASPASIPTNTSKYTRARPASIPVKPTKPLGNIASMTSPTWILGNIAWTSKPKLDLTQDTSKMQPNMSMVPKKPIQVLWKSASSLIPTANADYSWMNLFKDEVEAYSKMKEDGLSDEEAHNLIKDRRKDLMWGNTKLSQDESRALLKMQQDWLTADEAVKMLDEYRVNKPTPKAPEQNILQKVWTAGINLTLWALWEAWKAVSNIMDFATLWKAWFWEEAKSYEKGLQETWAGESTAWKIWAGIVNVWSALALPTIWKGLISSWMKTWAAYGALNPIEQQGSETKLKDIWTSAVIWWVIWWVAWWLIKWWTKWKDYITQKLPANLQLKWLLNPAKLEQVNNSLIQEWQKTPENVWKWMLERWITWSKSKIVSDLENRAMQSKKAVDDSLAVIDKTTLNTYKNVDIDKALTQVKNDLEWIAWMESKLKEVNDLLWKWKYTLTEANKAKRILDEQYNLYKQSWGETAWVKAEWLRNVRQNIREFIEKTAEKNWVNNIKLLNNETSVAKSLSNAITKKESSDYVRELLSPFAGWTIWGIMWPNIWPFKGDDMLSRVWNVLAWALIWKWLTSTYVKSSTAGILNKLNSRELWALDKYIQTWWKSALEKNLRDKVNNSIRWLLPRAWQTTKSAIITPQTIEKWIIQESKIPLKNTKYGNTTNSLNSISNSNNVNTSSLKKNPLWKAKKK